MSRAERAARPRSGVRQSTARLVHRALQRLGVDLVRVKHIDDFTTRRTLALSGTDVVVDVGANTGQYGDLLRRHGFRGRIISFEPLPVAYEELQRHAAGDHLWTCLPIGLSDIEGEAILNVSVNQASSSLLELTAKESEEAPETSIVARLPVEVRRLDSIRDELFGPEDRLFLKLDVQGAEERVLAGATGTLGRVRAVECELSILELYEGQPLMSDLARALSSKGFRLAAVEPEYRDLRSGELKQVNGLFLAGD